MTEIIEPSLRDILQVKPPSEIVRWINSLIFSEPGNGKTHLIGTADDDERTRPLLVLDCEGGLATLRNRPSVDTKEIRSIIALTGIYNDIYKSIKYDEEGIPQSIYYKTIAIDTLSELAALDMRVIMKEAKNKNPENVDIDVPSPREWGKSREHIRMIVRAFRDLPCNVIFTAHVTEKKEEGKPTRYIPNFAGKLGSDVPGFVDIVGYLIADVIPGGDGAISRRLQVAGTRAVVAKDRTSTLGGILHDPTIPKIWDLINSTPESRAEILGNSGTQIEIDADASLSEGENEK